MKILLLRLALLAAALAFCAMPARAAEPDWPDQLRIGTASPGGTYYVYGEALAKIRETGAAVNFATLIGHNTVRESVMGAANRAPTIPELAKMQSLVWPG